LHFLKLALQFKVIVSVAFVSKESILTAQDYPTQIRQHYQQFFGIEPKVHKWLDDTLKELPSDFRIFEFEPREPRNVWTYATCCMWQKSDMSPAVPQGRHQNELIELHLFSKERSTYKSGPGNHVELLQYLAHYHRTNERIALSHCIPFERPWIDESECTYGLITYPYLDGPKLEMMELEDVFVQSLWVVPITQQEFDFQAEIGTFELEKMFFEVAHERVDYLDTPRRKSFVG